MGEDSLYNTGQGRNVIGQVSFERVMHAIVVKKCPYWPRYFTMLATELATLTMTSSTLTSHETGSDR